MAKTASFSQTDVVAIQQLGERLLEILVSTDIDAALAAYACVECARAMLNGYQAGRGRDEMTRILVRYLASGEAPADLVKVRLS